LGHGQGRRAVQTDGRPGPAAGYLPRGHERSRSQACGQRHDDPQARRFHVRSQKSGTVREKLPRQQSGWLRKTIMKNFVNSFGLSLVGIALLVGVWAILSQTVAPDLPSPAKT